MSETDRAGPLAGIRVVEMGQLIAGPFCGQLLGDMGAEVVKIEPPAGNGRKRKRSAEKTLAEFMHKNLRGTDH